MIQAVFTSIMY